MLVFYVVLVFSYRLCCLSFPSCSELESFYGCQMLTDAFRLFLGGVVISAGVLLPSFLLFLFCVVLASLCVVCWRFLMGGRFWSLYGNLTILYMANHTHIIN